MFKNSCTARLFVCSFLLSLSSLTMAAEMSSDDSCELKKENTVKNSDDEGNEFTVNNTWRFKVEETQPDKPIKNNRANNMKKTNLKLDD